MQGSWKAVEGSTDHVIRLTMFRGLDAGRLESRASASSLTDRQCIVLSSGRLACFAGPWVCLKEPPQPAFTLPPSCYPPALHLHQLHCSPTASSQTLSLYHDTSPTAPLYKTPLQPPSSQHIDLSTRHRYQLQPALSPLSRPQPPHPRHRCIAPHFNTPTLQP